MPRLSQDGGRIGVSPPQVVPQRLCPGTARSRRARKGQVDMDILNTARPGVLVKEMVAPRERHGKVILGIREVSRGGILAPRRREAPGANGRVVMAPMTGGAHDVTTLILREGRRVTSANRPQGRVQEGSWAFLRVDGVFRSSSALGVPRVGTELHCGSPSLGLSRFGFPEGTWHAICASPPRRRPWGFCCVLLPGGAYPIPGVVGPWVGNARGISCCR